MLENTDELVSLFDNITPTQDVKGKGKYKKKTKINRGKGKGKGYTFNNSIEDDGFEIIESLSLCETKEMKQNEKDFLTVIKKEHTYELEEYYKMFNEIGITSGKIKDNKTEFKKCIENIQKLKTELKIYNSILLSNTNEYERYLQKNKEIIYKLNPLVFKTLKVKFTNIGIKQGIIYKGFNTKDTLLSLSSSVKKKGIKYNILDSTICIDNYEGTLYFFKLVNNYLEYDSKLILYGENINSPMFKRVKCISANSKFNYNLSEFKIIHIFVGNTRKSSLIEEW
jgi:hypothetical protein